MSVMTLFLTDRHNDDVGVDAVTGAIHSCFPGVPEEDINALVTETSAAMLNAEASALARLQYETMQGKDLEGSSHFPWITFFLAVSLALGAGFVMGQRMKPQHYMPIHGYELSSMGRTVFGSRFD